MMASIRFILSSDYYRRFRTHGVVIDVLGTRNVHIAFVRNRFLCEELSLLVHITSRILLRDQLARLVIT